MPQFRNLAWRRMAATALAIRLYQLDHGQRPADLAQLVPEYLPAVPLDPFNPTGGPLRYRPAATPPILYSVHEDGVDDGGEYDTRRWGPDLDFFLDGGRPRSAAVGAPASTPAADAGSEADSQPVSAPDAD